MKLMLGDSKIKLKGLPDNSVDSLVSDPPYGMSFMGKDWDKALPPVEIWKETLRTMKPGSFGFVMCIPRQDCLSRMIISLEDAGFNINFSPIYWTYATGFPKAHNISKGVDKKFGVERGVVGKQYNIANKNNNNTGRYNWNTENSERKDFINITTPATEQAKQFEGSYGGFQPKPAVEVIIVVQKPTTEPTFVAQALKNGKGCTWLDDCRIPYKDDSDRFVIDNANLKIDGSGSGVYGWNKHNNTIVSGVRECHEQGRFPANLLVSDDVLDDHSKFFSLDAWAEKNLPFLIVPKASKAEKNKGCNKLEERSRKVGNRKKYNNSGQFPDNDCRVSKNNHPTVKPIKLMSYLITMGSREGDTILDPFMGSGTTGCAAALLHREFIGIEMDEHSMEIAKARIKYWSRQALQEKIF